MESLSECLIDITIKHGDMLLAVASIKFHFLFYNNANGDIKFISSNSTLRHHQKLVTLNAIYTVQHFKNIQLEIY